MSVHHDYNTTSVGLIDDTLPTIALDTEGYLRIGYANNLQILGAGQPLRGTFPRHAQRLTVSRSLWPRPRVGILSPANPVSVGTALGLTDRRAHSVI